MFAGGAGSYDVILPKVKELLRRHRGRPVGARVTLTSAGLDVVAIFRHLTEEVGFHEVGFAPVTTSPQREHALGDGGFDGDAGAVPRALAVEFRDAAVLDQPHGFSNVKDTLAEIHKGVAKAWPCGAGLGLMGVATDGEVALCHRFAGSAEHRLGNVRDGHRPRASGRLPGRPPHRGEDRLPARAGRARSARAAATTRRTRATARRSGRTSTTASGSGAGPTPASRSTASSRERNPRYLARFDGGGHGMKHLRAVNRKAGIVEITTAHGTRRAGGSATAAGDVVALADPPQQPAGPWVPLGCSFVFFPGWEVDRSGGTAGLCQPVERDLFDCHIGCFWPAQVPTSSTTPPTGPASARPPRRTGARSTSSSRERLSGRPSSRRTLLAAAAPLAAQERCPAATAPSTWRRARAASSSWTRPPSSTTGEIPLAKSRPGHELPPSALPGQEALPFLRGEPRGHRDRGHRRRGRWWTP